LSSSWYGEEAQYTTFLLEELVRVRQLVSALCTMFSMKEGSTKVKGLSIVQAQCIMKDLSPINQVQKKHVSKIEANVASLHRHSGSYRARGFLLLFVVRRQIGGKARQQKAHLFPRRLPRIAVIFEATTAATTATTTATRRAQVSS